MSGGGWGERGGTNFQLLVLSPNLLKSKIPMSGGGGGGGRGGNPFSTFDAEFKFAKIQNSHVQWRGGGFGGTHFQLLMLSPNLLKSKISMSMGGRGEVWWNQFPTFDAESKFAQIQNSHVCWGGGGGLVEPISNF